MLCAAYRCLRARALILNKWSHATRALSSNRPPVSPNETNSTAKSSLSDKEYKIRRKRHKTTTRLTRAQSLPKQTVSWGEGIERTLVKDETASEPSDPASSPKPWAHVKNMTIYKYQPSVHEEGWCKVWENEMASGDKPNGGAPFTMVLPPPNVTGALHMGHAFDITIQDAMARYKTMRGFDTRWIPGCDHAGIATQVVVEKSMAAEIGDSSRVRSPSNRQNFLESAQSWKAQHEARIKHQIKRLGSHLDWSKYVFTLDEGYRRAVTEAFILLFNRGLISRKKSLITWCPALQSSISDEEIDMRMMGDEPVSFVGAPEGFKSSLFGKMFYIKYSVEDSEETITVATTRPETMFGDVALAVSPDDSRYQGLIGKHCINPVNGQKLPVVADSSIKSLYGTGVMKLTPAHARLDNEIAERAGITEKPVIFNKDGTLNVECGDLAGMQRYLARDAVFAMLHQQGKIQRVDRHQSEIPVCSRTGDFVECLPLEQWFLDCRPLADKCLAMRHQIQVFPGSLERIFVNILKNADDWCISRQIWWGHQIPAYSVSVGGEPRQRWVAAHSPESARKEAALLYNCCEEDVEVQQDCDVLDTWFSSALHPIASLGWPDRIESDDGWRRYPMDVLVTGKDILHSWVVRMCMMGAGLTDKLPFRRVYLHGLVLDPTGRKMSKSLGNVIDPLAVVNGSSPVAQPQDIVGDIQGKRVPWSLFDDKLPACGADALRLGIVRHLNNKAENIRFDMNVVKSSLRFCNKLRNVTKLLSNTHETTGIPIYHSGSIPRNISAFDDWLLSKLAKCIQRCEQNYENCYLKRIADDLIIFIGLFSDVNLRYMSTVSRVEDIRDYRAPLKRSSVETSGYVFLEILKLAHPLIPFYTEELFQKLRYRFNPDTYEYESLTKQGFPDHRKLTDALSNSFMYEFNCRSKDLDSRTQLIDSTIALTQALAKEPQLRTFSPSTLTIDSQDFRLVLPSQQVLAHNYLAREKRTISFVDGLDVKQGGSRETMGLRWRMVEASC